MSHYSLLITDFVRTLVRHGRREFNQTARRVLEGQPAEYTSPRRHGVSTPGPLRPEPERQFAAFGGSWTFIIVCVAIL